MTWINFLGVKKMGMTSRFREWFDTQTALDKMALGLVFMSMPVSSLYGLAQFAINVAMTVSIVYIQFKHKKEMSSFAT